MTERRNLAMANFGLMVLLASWSCVVSRKNLQLTVWFVGAFLMVGELLTTIARHGAELDYRYGLWGDVIAQG